MTRSLPLRASLLPASLLAALLPGAAFAHPGHALSGSSGQLFAEGLAHPLSGADHLVAMLMIGLWAAQAGRPGRRETSGGVARMAPLLAPAAFIGAMLVGAFLAGTGLPGAMALPLAEQLILASVLVSGLTLALAWRLPVLPALAGIAAFGFAHGAAHGAEAPGHQLSALLPFMAGFTLSTLALHLAGIALGRWLPQGGTVSRLLGSGALIAGFTMVFAG